MRFTILFSFLLFLTFNLSAQQAGLRLYSGVTSAKNRVLAVTPENASHNGFHFGADGRLNSGQMFFVLGLRYTKIDLLARSESEFFSNETNHTLINGRVGLGWHLIQFGYDKSIRAKLLGQIDFNGSHDNDLLDGDFNQLVGAAASGVAGVGIQYKFLTIDLEYEYGLVNLYSNQKETKVDALSFSLGFFF